MTAFEERKRKILASLAQPVELYADASPKGSVDEGIRDFVDEINQFDGFVTTSSCAGRIAVYQEGFSGSRSSEELDDTNLGTFSTSAGGKGGGQWLYVSHDPIPLDGLNANEDILTLFSLSHNVQPHVLPGPQSTFIHVKFEPMILHVLCSSLDNARRLLGAALSSGFRESGISSISNDHDMVLVAVRTNGLAFDSIVAFRNGSESDTPVLLVTEHYLRVLVDISNQRSQLNQARKERFRLALIQAINAERALGRKHDSWEPTDVRRARKQAEGLAKQREVENGSGPASTNKQDSEMYEVGLEDLLQME